MADQSIRVAADATHGRSARAFLQLLVRGGGFVSFFESVVVVVVNGRLARSLVTIQHQSKSDYRVILRGEMFRYEEGDAYA